jgi:hypothetical protein
MSGYGGKNFLAICLDKAAAMLASETFKKQEGIIRFRRRVAQ